VVLDLTGCRAKLAHAEGHIDLLRTEIAKAGAPDPNVIPLHRQYERDQGAVVYRLGRVIQIDEAWSLIVGDAVHNLRSALDHLMWQLAKRHLGRVPTEKEAKSIQFPVIYRVKDFSSDRFLRYVNPDDVARLKPYQPYKRLKKGELYPLPKLVRLSNIDKHRQLHLLVTRPHKSALTNRSDAYVDCVARPILIPGGGYAHVHVIAPGRNPRPNDPVLLIFVTPTGPNPDVDFNMSLTAFVGMGRLGPVIPMLEFFATYVGSVINAFA